MRWSDTWLPFIFRMILALILFGAGLWVAGRYALLFAYPFWFLAGLLIAYPLAGFLARPFGAVFMPTERFSKPPPMYSVPESLRMKNELEAAMLAYEKIAAKYPQELKPYVEMIRLAFVDMNREDLAAAILERGLSILKKPAARESLERSYDRLGTLTRVPPTAESRRKVSYRKSDL